MKAAGSCTDIFVEEVRKLRFDNAFNPYSELCKIWDKPTGPSLRRQNLRNVFQAAMAHGVHSVWIGRDLGYRGGRRTGLALTDEVHLQDHCRLLKTAPLHRATKGPAVGERTALIVWKMLQLINRPVFLWNVFPLHPHEPGDPLSNRSHTRAERQACRSLLLAVLEGLRPRNVIAIGRDAHAALEDIEIAAVHVRHPSYGGHNQFVSGICGIYNVSTPSIESSQPVLL